MEVTHNSLPGGSFGGFSAYGGIRPGQLERTFLTAKGDTTRFASPCAACVCLCTPVHEAKEMLSAGPCFCLCGGTHEAEEMLSAGPCFCLCGGTHEGNA
jgi:hypothetical protein